MRLLGNSTDAQKKKLNGIKLPENLSAYIFLFPWLLGLLIFQLWPILDTLRVSFYNFDIFNQSYAGLDNYRELIHDDLFWKTVRVTLTYVVMTVPLRLIFALFVAVILNRNIRGIGLYRTVYYLPSIVGNSVALAILWRAFFQKDGVFNLILLKIFGITGPAWLGDPGYSLNTIGLLSIWQFGSAMVIFLAGLKQIPSEIYESASIDGAGAIRKFFSITVPFITPMIFFNLLMQMINAFQTFAAPYIIYNGDAGPINSVLLFVMYIYKQGFQTFRMGYASALAWSLMVVIGTATLLLFKSQKKWVFYNS